MAKIKIKDLPKNMKIDREEMKRITGGGSVLQGKVLQGTIPQGTSYQGVTLQATSYIPMVYLSTEKDDE